MSSCFMLILDFQIKILLRDTTTEPSKISKKGFFGEKQFEAETRGIALQGFDAVVPTRKGPLTMTKLKHTLPINIEKLMPNGRCNLLSA